MKNIVLFASFRINSILGKILFNSNIRETYNKAKIIIELFPFILSLFIYFTLKTNYAPNLKL